MNENPLSQEEQEALRTLKKPLHPPKDLERRIVAQMKSEGLIKASPLKRFVRWGLMAAASLIFFISGIAYERQANTAINIDPSNGFMLVLHENDEFKATSSVSEEYRLWKESIANQGVKIIGQELRNESTLISSNETTKLSAENQNRITGYFLLEASSLKEVLTIASNSPHIKYGGSIEVKEYMVR